MHKEWFTYQLRSHFRTPTHELGTMTICARRLYVAGLVAYNGGAKKCTKANSCLVQSRHTQLLASR